MTNLEKCIAEIEFRFPCVRDHEFTSKEWQTLKAAVLAQQPNNNAMDAIAALADKWCDSTNQPDNICVALYQFTSWARQQHQ